MGCYGNCYALQIAKRYRLDFTHIVKRGFVRECDQLYLFDVSDQHHIGQIVHEIKNIDMPFFRIGEMGDPSYNWEHTINVCETLSIAEKPMVIITKHWEIISDYLLERIKKIDICINTSISALDNKIEVEHRLKQYERLKDYCNSVLRVVTCDFNTDNDNGKEKDKLQKELLAKENVIDTVFRPDKENMYIESGLIKAESVQFLGKKCLVSMWNKKNFFSYCNECPDMCGINFKERHSPPFPYNVHIFLLTTAF